MNNTISAFIDKFEQDPTWFPLYSIAFEYWFAKQYQQALAYISACLQFEIPTEEKFKVYQLSYKIFKEVGLKKQADLYFDSCMALEKRKASLVDDYPKFYSVPVLYVQSAMLYDNAWMGIQETFNGHNVIDENAYFLVLEKDMIPDPYSLAFAYLTGLDNNKDMVILGDEKSYIVSARLLKKFGVPSNYLFLKEKAEEFDQVMSCPQATLTQNAKLQS